MLLLQRCIVTAFTDAWLLCVCARRSVSSLWNWICIFCHSRILSPDFFILILFFFVCVGDCNMRWIVYFYFYFIYISCIMFFFSLFSQFSHFIFSYANESPYSRLILHLANLHWFIRKFTHKSTSAENESYHHTCRKACVRCYKRR